MSLYHTILDELSSRNVYKYETYSPFYICSWAMHIFNLYNQKQQIYWEAKRLPNMRMHCLFVAPPGFMKSFYLQQMGGSNFGVFNNTGTDMLYEQYMTEAGFVGTVQTVEGCAVPTEGAAYTCKNGILMIDEFSAITKALQMQHSSQLDTQMLSALDHGHITKHLGSGKLEYDTYLTLWAGVQPSRFDLTSGMGRRLVYLIYIPTKKDNEELLETMHMTRNVRPDVQQQNELWSKIKKFKDGIEIIKRVEFDDSVLKKYKELKLYSYESSYFDRMLIGYQLAMYGPEEKMRVTINGDKELNRIIDTEKKWRTQISTGIEFIQLVKIIQEAGGSIQRAQLMEDISMYGWNSIQMNEMLLELKRLNMIKIEGNTILVEM